MFAVPGWSIPTSEPKPQTEFTFLTNGASIGSNSVLDDSSSALPKSKKRKRYHGIESNGNSITPTNIDEMFRRHIEGRVQRSNSETHSSKAPRKGDKKKEKKEKKNILDTGLLSTLRKNRSESKQGESGRDLNEEQLSLDTEDRKLKKSKQQGNQRDGRHSNGTLDPTINESLSTNASLSPPPPRALLTPLQQKMREKLLSARFRHLNETLYTAPSGQALELFTSNPKLFAEYHAGFSRQVKESWPFNPVNGYIETIKVRGAAVSGSRKRMEHNTGLKAVGKMDPLPRRSGGLCTIADLGCGDARLAHTLIPSAKRLNLKFLSYDLYSLNPLVTKADISSLPLGDGTVDIAVFCLSLMGTNWVSFVDEAWRILRGDGKGECWVSEVKSRFGKAPRKKGSIGSRGGQRKLDRKKTKGGKNNNEGDVGSGLEEAEADIFIEDTLDDFQGDETDLSAFIGVFQARGFTIKPESVNKSNKMFIKMEFVKQGPPVRGKYAVATALNRNKRRFIDDLENGGNGLTLEEETKVLKPCVYKSR